MKSKFCFLVLALLTFPLVALADPGPPPRLPFKAAVIWVARQTGFSPREVLKNFEMNWLRDFSYDDDEPIDFYFLNTKMACTVEVGSHTLIVRSGSCDFR
jgi:hypothetical protein